MKRLMTICVLIALCAAVTPTWGTLVYTDESSFTAALQTGYYLEEFNYTSYAYLGTGPLNFGPTNDFSFSATSTSGFYSVLPGGNGALSTLYGDDTMTITFTGDPVNAVGGRFFGTDYDGNYTSATIRIVLNDGTVEEYSNVNITDFRGFVSSVALSSLSISIPGAGHEPGPYPTLDHFYTGVPEPTTLVLLGLGSVVSLVTRKRRA